MRLNFLFTDGIRVFGMENKRSKSHIYRRTIILDRCIQLGLRAFVCKFAVSNKNIPLLGVFA